MASISFTTVVEIHFESDEMLEQVVSRYSGHGMSPEDLLSALEDMVESGEIEAHQLKPLLSTHFVK